MFEKKMYIMDFFDQSGPSGMTRLWLAGAEVNISTSISNMMDVKIAQASGVIPTGYITPHKNLIQKYKIGNGTYFMVGIKRTERDYDADYFIHVVDKGIDEPETFFDVRQLAVEVVHTLPQG